MVGQFGISGGEAFHREGLLNEADDFGGIHFSHVGIIQQFRHIHVIPQSGIGVADDLVPARVDAEDVLEDDEDAGALADVVDLESGDVLVLADGLVVEGEGRPGARRTAFELGLVAALAGVFGIAVDATHVNFT